MSASLWPWAARVAVRASIFFSSSATLLSVFFCRFRLGAVTIHCLPALPHLLQVFGLLTSSNSHLTLRPRHASHARGRFMSSGFAGSPLGLWSSAGLSCVVGFCYVPCQSTMNFGIGAGWSDSKGVLVLCACWEACSGRQNLQNITEGDGTQQNTYRVVIGSRRHALKGRARRPLDRLDG